MLGAGRVGQVRRHGVVANERAVERARPRGHRAQLHRVADQLGGRHLGPYQVRARRAGPPRCRAPGRAGRTGRSAPRRRRRPAPGSSTSSTGSSRQHLPPSARRPAAPAPRRSGTRRRRSRRCAPCRRRGSPRRSTTGWPATRPAFQLRPHALLHATGCSCAGTAPPTTWSTNSKPAPRGSGSTSMSHTAYWPCPPDCLTWRPCPLARASRSSPASPPAPARCRARRRRPAAGPAPRRRAPRPCTTARAGGSPGCAPAAVVGSAATSRARFLASASSSRAGLGHDRDRQQRLRHVPRRDQQRMVLGGDRVAGLGAARLGDARRCRRPRTRRPRAAGRPAASRCARPARRRRGRGARARRRPWPGRRAPPCSGRSVPENTRTSETRPTYGSMVVLTTSATSGPSGSQVSGVRGAAVHAGHHRQVVLQRRREAAGEHLEQRVEAEPVSRADRDHRVERAAGDGRLQVVDEGA